MDTIIRLHGESSKLQMKIDLSKTNRVYEDITDVLFEIKDHGGQDDNVYFFKKKSLNEIDLTYANGVIKAEIHWLADEYDNLVIGKSYKAACFCMFNGETTANESVEDIFNLIVEQDFSRA